jgi:hypothetical protein
MMLRERCGVMADLADMTRSQAPYGTQSRSFSRLLTFFFRARAAAPFSGSGRGTATAYQQRIKKREKKIKKPGSERGTGPAS